MAVALAILNYVMMIGGALVKLPQVISLFKAKQGKSGLSEASLVTETIAFFAYCAYNLLKGYSIATWGEAALIAIQCIFQVGLFWKLEREQLDMKKRLAGVIVVLSSMAALYMGVLPVELVPVLGMVPSVVGMASRLPQIMMNFGNKYTGVQSLFTCGLSACGNSVRLFTTLMSHSDPITLAGYLIGLGLSVTLSVQILMYSSNVPPSNNLPGRSQNSNLSRSPGRVKGGQSERQRTCLPTRYVTCLHAAGSR